MAGIREEVQMLVYIWKQLFISPYCTVVKPNYPASTHLLKQPVIHIAVESACDYLKSIFGRGYKRQRLCRANNKLRKLGRMRSKLTFLTNL